MARPKKIISMQRNIPVASKLSESEYQTFLNNVEKSGMKRSEYLRECIIGDTTEIHPVNTECETLEQTRIYLLSTIANNCNQLAKAVNTSLKKNDIQKAITLLEKIEDLRSGAFEL